MRPARAPTAADALASTVDGVTHSAVAGVALTLTLTTRDSRGQPLHAAADLVHVALDSSDAAHVDGCAMDNSDGTWTLSILPVSASATTSLSVMLNGAHVSGSPFALAVHAGETSARDCVTSGSGLFDATTSSPGRFSIVAMDSFGNRRTAGGDAFRVELKLIDSLAPECNVLDHVPGVLATVRDQGDGSYDVTTTAPVAGHYSLEVSLDDMQLSSIPARACVMSECVEVPQKIPFEPLKTRGSAVGAEGHQPPECDGFDCAVVHDRLVVLESQPHPQMRKRREFLHSLAVEGWDDSAQKEWVKLTLRASSLPVLPKQRVSVAMDHALVCLGHGKTGAAMDDVRVLDLWKSKSLPIGWTAVVCDGEAPSAVGGYAATPWEERRSVLVFGGELADGAVCSSVHVLTLEGSAEGACGAWAQLDAANAPAARRGHSLTALDGSHFLAFGGTDADGRALGDVHILGVHDDSGEGVASWTRCETSGAPPAPRFNHAACVVARRHVIVYGGMDAGGQILGDLASFDSVLGMWTVLDASRPRALHRMLVHAGQIIVMGGLCADGCKAPAGALAASCASFRVRGGMSFSGAKECAVACKVVSGGGDVGLALLGNSFCVEASFLVRSTAPRAHSPVVVKSDNGLKTGFGIVVVEHPCFELDVDEGLFVHFFYGSLLLSAGGHVRHRIQHGNWYHACGVCDEGELRLYLNGSLKDQCTIELPSDAEATLHSKGDVHIGGLPSKCGVDGAVDTVRVWDEALDESDIQSMMNSVVEKRDVVEGDVSEHLVAQWSFNEGSGDVVYDSSGNGAHGELLPRASDEGAAADEEWLAENRPRRIKVVRDDFEYSIMSSSEAHVDAQFTQLQAFKSDFEEAQGRAITRADYLLAPAEIKSTALRFGAIAV